MQSKSILTRRRSRVSAARGPARSCFRRRGRRWL